MTKILPLILLIAGLFLGIFLVTQKTYFAPKADISSAPEEIKISNISDNSFTVSWITKRPIIGFISYGPTLSLETAAADTRDEANRKERLTHYVTLENLEPDTVYYFKIGRGAESYDQEDRPFEQKTAPTTTNTPPLPETVFGTVVKADQNIPEEGLVYIEVGDNTLLSTFLDETGKWLLTLNNARTADLASYLTLKDDDVLDIFVEGALGGTLKKQILGKDRESAQDFTLEENRTVGFYEENNSEGDLNGDGVVNAFDFAISIKRLFLTR